MERGLEQSTKTIVKYHLRGEGMANYVVGFARDDQHMVWRIRKTDLHGKLEENQQLISAGSGSIDIICSELELSLRFVKEIIMPLFERGMGSKLIILPTQVNVNGGRLMEMEKEWKVFSTSKDGNRVIVSEETVVSVLEMPDLTVYLPGSTVKTSVITDFDHHYSSVIDKLSAIEHDHRKSSNIGSDRSNHSPVIGVEIKPKQGFIPVDLLGFTKTYFGSEIDLVYCTNCVSQYDKCNSSGDRQSIYNYCPLDLYSGDTIRIKRALIDLIRRPKTHLKIFRDGKPVFDKNRLLSMEEIGDLMFDNTDGHAFDKFLDCLARILQYAEGDSNPEDSVLGSLLQAQKIDELGPLTTASLVEELQHLSIITDPNKAFPLYFADHSFTDDQIHSKLESIKSGLICQTLRDCSIMITMQVRPGNCEVGNSGQLKLSNGSYFDDQWLIFHVALVDLDAKTPKKAVKYRERLLKGLELLKTDYENGYYKRVSCLSRGYMS